MDKKQSDTYNVFFNFILKCWFNDSFHVISFHEFYLFIIIETYLEAIYYTHEELGLFMRSED